MKCKKIVKHWTSQCLKGNFVNSLGQKNKWERVVHCISRENGAKKCKTKID